MTDIVDAATRSRIMSGIRGKDTAPELVIRKLLHAQGFRFRLHTKDLPGKPDIVLPKYRVVVFVHGCFWHWHGCSLSKLPSTRRKFWTEKLTGNRQRDARNRAALLGLGWRCAVVWECAIRGASQNDRRADTATLLAAWIRRGVGPVLEIGGA
jgi:DNA mismatch endonuclease (patch repair protein)